MPVRYLVLSSIIKTIKKCLMALLPEQAQLKKNQFQGEGIICMWVFYPSYCIVTSSYQRLVAALKESEGVINYKVFP